MTNDSARVRVWFPNGNVINPDSIRLGLRDYGTKPVTISRLFNELKNCERPHKDQKNGQKKLAENIILTQEKEIEYMKQLIKYNDKSS